MVKRKKHKEAQKHEDRFAVSPFKALKGVRVEEAKPAEQHMKETLPKTPEPEKKLPAADDLDLFLRAMSDVRKLDGTVLPSRVRRREAPAKPFPEVLAVEDRDLFLEAMQGMQVMPKDEGEGASRKQAATSRMKQLQRGEIRIDFELDLHGLTRDEALGSLEHFIGGAFRRNQPAVLVITGKGYNSPGEPVLQGAVAAWLREHGKGKVAEFFPAPRHMGGSGAYVVFLKERGKAK